MIKWSAFAVFVGWIFCPAEVFASSFKITAIKGDVLALYLGQSDWVSLSGDTEVPADTLIQIRQGASLKATFPEPRKSNLSLSHPMIVRLNDDLLRKIDIGELDLGDVPSFDPSESTSPLPLSLSAAWERILVYAEGLDWLKFDFSKNPQDSGMSESTVGTSAERLRIISPGPLEYKEVVRFPSYIDVTWVPYEKDASLLYEIFVANEHNDESGAFTKAGSTTATAYRVHLWTPGRYKIQVRVAGSSSMRSRVHELVALPMAERAARNIDYRQLEVLSPPTNYTEVLGESMKSTSITFSWQRSASMSADAEVTLNVKSKKRGGKSYKFAVGGDQISVQLRPGDYLWSLTWKEDGSVRQSRERALSVVHQNSLAELLPASGSATIHIGY